MHFERQLKAIMIPIRLWEKVESDNIIMNSPVSLLTLIWVLLVASAQQGFESQWKAIIQVITIITTGAFGWYEATDPATHTHTLSNACTHTPVEAGRKSYRRTGSFQPLQWAFPPIVPCTSHHCIQWGKKVFSQPPIVQIMVENKYLVTYKQARFLALTDL
jgi:hypothetical protein